MSLKETLIYLSQHSEYVELSQISGVQIDLRYGSTRNFMNADVYGDFDLAFLHRIAAEKLAKASLKLQELRPGWNLLVLDALRPRAVQRLLWKHVEGTAEQAYVANPDRGSLHNYGFSVDLTLIDAAGQEVDMGTEFDAFVELSEPRREDEFLQSGKLHPLHLENRLVLRSAMTEAGFLQLPHEWWHFDALPGDEVRSRFTLIE